jgi:site-specific DNA-methyltransferase (adenine-specific)
MTEKLRAERNQTVTLDQEEIDRYKSRLIQIDQLVDVSELVNKTIHQDLHSAVQFLPEKFVDLLFIDPPYNLYKKFNQKEFYKKSADEYCQWIDDWLSKLIKILKPNASIYICADWLSSQSVYQVAKNYFKIQNRITWEREKGRGSLRNWKNSMEDIWFCTMTNKYTFHVNDVKLKKKVIAPYKDTYGEPKDWKESDDGNYRLTHPSNLWNDITVPFWSMTENTDHPTQKPEKLVAKIILASSNKGECIFDPFLGSGTTSVVAKKLGRNYVGIEHDETYCCLAEKRIEIADDNQQIQGYGDGVFWERNSRNGKS